jgi:hypothetical protein
MSDDPHPAHDVEQRTDLERYDDLVDYFYGDHQRVRKVVRKIGLDIAEAMAAGHPIYIADEKPGLLWVRSTNDGGKTSNEFGSRNLDLFNRRSGLYDQQIKADRLESDNYYLKKRIEMLEEHNDRMDEIRESSRKSDERHYHTMRKLHALFGVLVGAAIVIIVAFIVVRVKRSKRTLLVDIPSTFCYTSSDVNQTIHNYSPEAPTRLIGRRPTLKPSRFPLTALGVLGSAWCAAESCSSFGRT